MAKFFIDGKWVTPSSNKTHIHIDPATETPIAEIPMGTEKDVALAVAAANRAFVLYGQSTREERLELLRRLLECYNDKYDELAALMTREMGSPLSFSKAAQALMGRIHLETGIAALEQFDFDTQRGDMLISKQPIGVCGLITPWNWPMHQLMLKVVPALAAGCTMVVKPSEYSPLSAVLVAELIDRAGFPAGVYNYVQGLGEEVGAALSRHQDVQMVSITGSTRAGIAVARDAAPTVKRVVQELGGKSPNILLPDADFSRAVADGVDRCFINCGQACVAATRMLVPMERMEEATALAAERANAFVVGSPLDENTDLGPVVNKTQFDKIQSLIEAGIADGATLAAGGPGLPEGIERGYYVRPTIFANVTNDMRIAREEIFGPVLVLIGYADEDEAISIANDTPYGLGAYIQTANIEAARRLSRRLQAGAIFINEAVYDPRAPFGGFKQSGNGREGGAAGIEEYLEVKTIGGYGALDFGQT